jgi:hypothetical protein
MHGKMPILGFRIGSFAYITDMKTIGDGELPYLEGVETFVLVGNGNYIVIMDNCYPDRRLLPFDNLFNFLGHVLPESHNAATATKHN